MAEVIAWTVRSEQRGDEAGIDRVLRRAFGAGNAADLVARLREDGGYDPGLSLVAVEAPPSRRVVGHVLFSPIAIVHGAAPVPALALAPLGVLPDRQRCGIGAALVRHGLALCAQHGYALVLVVGDPGYYARFGFDLASRHGIEPPLPSWGAALQALAVLPGGLRDVAGTARYPAAFDDA